jgi:hypothetical protein
LIVAVAEGLQRFTGEIGAPRINRDSFARIATSLQSNLL